jgi:hypothetical protein
MDLLNTVRGYDWIEVALNSAEQPFFVNTVTNLRVP